MTSDVTLPAWLFGLILCFALITLASHFLFPSVRWFFRKRFERAVRRLNKRLQRPIEPFKLARRHDMIQQLSYDPDVLQAVVEHAKAEGMPGAVAFEEAKRYAREIVPAFSTLIYFGIATRLTRFIGQSFYRVRVAHFDEEAFNAVDPEAAVVFVINHRSNMDYVLITYMAAERSALSYAVGEWARIWPLSHLIRAMGAYFIQRRPRNELYRRVLAAYVRLSTQAGVTQALFPEGGLSLDGALAKPKRGLLNYIAMAHEEGGRDVVFIPVALNYDRVLEDEILIAAGQAGRRRFKARVGPVLWYWTRMLWLRIRGRFNRYGYAAVSFGAPVSLTDYRRDNPEADTRMLTHALMDRIAALVPILPVPLVSWLLVHGGRSSRAELEDHVRRLTENLPQTQPLFILPHDDVAYTVEVGLRTLLRRRLVREVGGVYEVAKGKGGTVTYYANSIAHLLSDQETAFCDSKDHSASAGS